MQEEHTPANSKNFSSENSREFQRAGCCVLLLLLILLLLILLLIFLLLLLLLLLLPLPLLLLPHASLHCCSYYMCSKCSKPYFGGMRRCEQNVEEEREFKPADLVRNA